MYPGKLNQIIALFESLPDAEKRESLISYAAAAMKQGPRDGETFDLEDIRKDEECTDTVGVFLKVTPQRNCAFRITLGPQVQTLTKAMTAILCKGLDGLTPEEIMEIYQLVTGIGIHACEVGIPLLMEALDEASVR